MATAKQELGIFGEKVVAKYCGCPRCKRTKTLKRLPNNFKCADIICDFCGFLGQVKSLTSRNTTIVPKTIIGAAWKPQNERMLAGIYFPLFVVLVKQKTDFSIFYLSADVQKPEMFIKRKPLSKTAKRAGWQGYMIGLDQISQKSLVKLFDYQGTRKC